MASEPETFQGSRHLGVLPDGCIQCRQGAKTVLFITGLCPSDCFYCPVSEEKIDHDLMFANERPLDAETDEARQVQLFEEIRATGSWGTGITGGDPLATPDRVLDYIRALKAEFGPEHHIHLYTQQFARDDYIRAMKDAGLDEWRIHPHAWLYGKFNETPYKRMVQTAREVGLTIGIEIPCTPGMEDDIVWLAAQAREAGAGYLNMNELEYAPINADNLRARDLPLVGDEDNRVAGSMEAGYRIIQRVRDELPGFTIHFCSSRFKDGTQMTKRLERRRERVAKPYMERTEDSTVVFGVLDGSMDALTAAYDRLLTQYEVPVEWIGLRNEPTPRLEVAPWVLEEIYEDFLELHPAIVEEYPTQTRLEVERVPLSRNAPDPLVDVEVAPDADDGGAAA